MPISSLKAAKSNMVLTTRVMNVGGMAAGSATDGTVLLRHVLQQLISMQIAVKLRMPKAGMAVGRVAMAAKTTVAGIMAVDIPDSEANYEPAIKL